ncbi:radical SAM protein [candidate division KSB1 bacterium]|nr:radical SAM protein [candidate division KSB1 bacterium]
MQINQIQAKSILQKTNIPGLTYVINPYVGCAHACVYCYACFMKKFTGHTEPWGTFLDVKINASQLLKKQIEKRRTPITEPVLLSSVTDPYTPFESRFKLTREILEVLLAHQIPISILTKSDTVLRDIDLLKKFDNCSVGLSLMTVDDEIGLRFEPRAPKPSLRIKALKQLRENGINTYAFISPFLPKLSDIDQLIAALDDTVNEIGVEALNTRQAYWHGVKQVLRKFYPQLLSGYKRLATDSDYWDIIEQKAQHLVAQQNISFMGFYRH